jgi:ABC-type uncharacterized transport system substrate-binding protein
MTGLLALLLQAAGLSAAGAHPHVWIDVVSDILFSPAGKMIGLKHSWTFDESYSVLAVQGLDTDRDGKYSAAELQPFMAKAFGSLKEWDYFSYASVDGRNVPFSKLRNAGIRYDKSQLTLDFELLMAAPADTQTQEVRFTVYDRSFYNLLSFVEQDPVWLGKDAPADCGFEIKPAKKGNRESTVVPDEYVASLGDDVNVGADYAEWVQLDCRKP